MDLDDFRFNDWIAQWAGTWSILTISYWGDLYTKKPFLDEIGQCKDHSIILWSSSEKSQAFWRASEKQRFGKAVNVLARNPAFMPAMCSKVRDATDRFLALEQSLFGKDITLQQYLKLMNTFLLDYYRYHIINKNAIDYFDDALAKKHFAEIEATRVYITPVLDRLDKFMIRLAEIHSAKTGYPPNLILSAIRDEFHDYLQGKPLPSKDILKKRHHHTVFLSKNQKTVVLTGSDIYDEAKALGIRMYRDLKGLTGFPGKVTGRVRIVHDSRTCIDFRKGDILVTGMSRPDYLPMMLRAAGFITDSGGVLCHAAVTAREMKKPCIVGTGLATEVLKDGDLVELDADNGIIRMIG
ncbi:MAG: PEP-utilizing enzyme [archaeon]